MKQEREYISWEDVARLVSDLEEEYGLRVSISACVDLRSESRALYWRVTANGAAEGDVTEVAWAGGTLRQRNARTVPGLLVGLLTTLSATIENRVAYASQELPF